MGDVDRRGFHRSSACPPAEDLRLGAHVGRRLPPKEQSGAGTDLTSIPALRAGSLCVVPPMSAIGLCAPPALTEYVRQLRAFEKHLRNCRAFPPRNYTF